MKKLLLIALIIAAFVGCTELKQLDYIPNKEHVYGIDFSKYAENNFLFTPEKYLGEYQSIGLLTYEIYPSAQYKRTNYRVKYVSNAAGDVTKEDFSTYEWVTNDVKVEQAVDSIYQKCLNMGADAFVSFDVERIIENYTGISNPTTITGVRITGFAIKRK